MDMTTDKITFAFDLDQTIINSDHRCNFSPEGVLDLKYWLSHHTEEYVMKDTLLPLADFAQKISSLCQVQNNIRMVAFTSRIIKSFDEKFLELHGLVFDKIYSRHQLDINGSTNLKKAQIEKELLLDEGKCDKMFFFEDHKDVLQMASKFECIKVINSVPLNQMIVTLGMECADIFKFLGIDNHST